MDTEAAPEDTIVSPEPEWRKQVEQVLIAQKRRSRRRIRNLLLATTALMLGGYGYLASNPEHIELSTASTSFSLPSKAEPPEPKLPIEKVFQRLRHPADVQRMLRKHTEYYMPEDFEEFLELYRLSPAEFLRRGKGPCNCYSEFWCQWLRSRGARPVIVRLVPTMHRTWDAKELANFEDRALDRLGTDIGNWNWKKTHEITILRTSERQFIIFDNTSYYVVNDCESIEQAALENFEGYSILGFGSIIEHPLTRPHWSSRMAMSFRFNLSDIPMHPDLEFVEAGTELADAS